MILSMPSRGQESSHAFDTCHLQAWGTVPVTMTDEDARRILVRRGFALEWATLGWNVAGIIILAIAAIAARSVVLSKS